MSNLLITVKCNRRCTFCFARRPVAKKDHGQKPRLEMSRAEIRYVMDFMARSEEYSLRLLGGEPTLHPEFCDIVAEAISRNFHILLFTNGFIAPETTDYLASLPKERISILCNISPQARDTSKQIMLRNNTLERLGDRLVQGITVTSEQIDFGYLLDNIRKYKLRKSIRIGVAQPIVGLDNEYLKPGDYRAAGRSIAKMAEACVKEDVLIGFDCGMTLCMFSERELGILTTRSQGYKSLCSPIIDIGPGLEVWHCFPLSEIFRTNLRLFNTRRQLLSYYQKLFKPYYSLGCKPGCLSCKFKQREQCFGGCLAHTLNALDRLPPRYGPEPIPRAIAHPEKGLTELAGRPARNKL